MPNWIKINGLHECLYKVAGKVVKGKTGVEMDESLGMHSSREKESYCNSCTPKQAVSSPGGVQ